MEVVRDVRQFLRGTNDELQLVQEAVGLLLGRAGFMPDIVRVKDREGFY